MSERLPVQGDVVNRYWIQLNCEKLWSEIGILKVFFIDCYGFVLHLNLYI